MSAMRGRAQLTDGELKRHAQDAHEEGERKELARLQSKYRRPVLQEPPHCDTCVNLTPFELTDDMFTCPVVNIRIHRQSVGMFGCSLHEPKLLPPVVLPAPSDAKDEADNSVVLAADAYALQCVRATGTQFEISDLIHLKAWFYAGARWAAKHPGADVTGPQSSTQGD